MNYSKESESWSISGEVEPKYGKFDPISSVTADNIRPFGAEDIPVPKSALDIQEGGTHYKKMAIQPIEFIHKNNIPFIEANCIKYLCRHRDKNKAEDIRKVIHYCQLILELEYNEKY